MTTTIDVRGTRRMLLYQRGARGIWQVKITVPGAAGHRIKSTGTTSQHEAVAFAISLYDEIYVHVKQGGKLPLQDLR